MSLPHLQPGLNPFPNHDAILADAVVKANKGGHLGV